MIPPFNDAGYLPPGIHSATLEEIAARFGQESELRRVQIINMELVDQDAFQELTEKVFASDRDLVPKGMVEVIS
ncbi:MAG: hypothetical protein HY721_33170 [Planctomycetes bacterium]|nr:hypothetical protein [Planctomycetota bacterium]